MTKAPPKRSTGSLDESSSEERTLREQREEILRRRLRLIINEILYSGTFEIAGGIEDFLYKISRKDPVLSQYIRGFSKITVEHQDTKLKCLLEEISQKEPRLLGRVWLQFVYNHDDSLPQTFNSVWKSKKIEARPGGLEDLLDNISRNDPILLEHIHHLICNRENLGSLKLQSFKRLGHLDIDDCIIPQEMELFSAFKTTLTWITLRRCTISKRSLALLIGYFPKLQHLRVKSLTYLTSDEPTAKVSRPLEKLSISVGSIGHDSLPHLLKDLSELGLRAQEVTLQCVGFRDLIPHYKNSLSAPVSLVDEAGLASSYYFPRLQYLRPKSIAYLKSNERTSKCSQSLKKEPVAALRSVPDLKFINELSILGLQVDEITKGWISLTREGHIWTTYPDHALSKLVSQLDNLTHRSITFLNRQVFPPNVNPDVDEVTNNFINRLENCIGLMNQVEERIWTPYVDPVTRAFGASVKDLWIPPIPIDTEPPNLSFYKKLERFEFGPTTRWDPKRCAPLDDRGLECISTITSEEITSISINRPELLLDYQKNIDDWQKLDDVLVELVERLELKGKLKVTFLREFSGDKRAIRGPYLPRFVEKGVLDIYSPYGTMIYSSNPGWDLPTDSKGSGGRLEGKMIIGDKETIYGGKGTVSGDERTICGDEGTICGDEKTVCGDKETICGDEETICEEEINGRDDAERHDPQPRRFDSLLRRFSFLVNK